MAISSDTLLERLHLKRQLTIWRLLAICSVIFFMVIMIEGEENISPVSGDFIARVKIEGMIVDDERLRELLQKIESNDKIKGVILMLDTPGGTAVGGEALYKDIKAIAEQKPVAAVMRTMCTSAGYMAAMGANRVFALDSSLTGSIGVIMQTMEATKLAEKLGINPITVKSGDFKATPSPTEPFRPKDRAMLEEVIADYFDTFLGIVAESRGMDKEQVRKLSGEGRIYTGKQAIKLELIDEIGGENEALAWFESEHELDAELDIRDMELKEEYEDILGKLGSYLGFSGFKKPAFALDGLLLIWQPSAL